METPEAAPGLASALAAGELSRRSPFSPTNTVTTEWKSDPVKTNELLRDIAKVLQSPVPSPAGYARRLEGEFQAEASSAAARPLSGGEQSAKELVASLERLLQKSPATDGQAALLSSLRGGSGAAPQAIPIVAPRAPGSAPPLQGVFASPLAAAAPPASSASAAAPRRTESRWQFLASRAASTKSPTAAGTALASHAGSGSPAAGAAAATDSVAALLQRISAVASPPATAAPSQAASPSCLPAAATAGSSPGNGSQGFGLVSGSPLSSPPAAAALPASPSPTLTRWQSIANRARAATGGGLPSPGAAPAEWGSSKGSSAAVLAAAVPAPAKPAALPELTRVTLPPVQLCLRPAGGLRFESEAAKVLGELEAFATLERTAGSQFQAAVAEQMGRLFMLPSS